MAKPIVIKIIGDTKKLKESTAKAEGFLGKLGKAGPIAGAGIAAGAAIAVGALVEIGLTAETMRANLVKGTGASGEALDDLFDSAKGVLSAVPDSGDVVSNVVADVNTHFGLLNDELESASENILDFARLTGTDASTAAESLNAQFEQFGLDESAENVNEVLGDMTRITQATGLPMEKLLNQMKTFGPIFSNANFSLEETQAIIGQLNQAGVDLTRVGPALNKFFRDTAAAGEDPQVALQGIVDQIASAEDSTAALNLATTAFGAEGAQRMTSAIRSGNFDLEDFNGLLGEGTGLVADQTEATETFSDKWNELKNKVFVKLMPVAEKLMDLLAQGMEAIGPAVQVAIDWYKKELQPVIEQVMKDIEDVIQSVTENILKFWDEWGEDIMKVLVVVFDLIKDHVKATFRIIKGIWEVFVGVFTGDWERAWKGVQEIFAGVVDKVVSVFRNLPKLLLAILPILKDAGIQLMKGFFRGMVQGINSLHGFIGDLRTKLTRALKDLLNRNVIDKINRALEFTINMPFGIPSANINPPDIPHLAFGGDVSRNGLFMVGERGPEVLRLPRGATVEPNHGAGARGLLGGDVVINAQTGASPAQIAEELAWIIQVRGV